MDFSLSFHDGLIALCTLVSPFLAVWAQRKIELARAMRGRKQTLFESLMAVRGETLSIDYKRAVNQIDIVYHQDKAVLNAWHNLFDSFHEEAKNEAEGKALIEKRSELLKKLLLEMSEVCGYDFDDRTIAKGYYSPMAHALQEDEQRRFRASVVSLVEGKGALRTMQVFSDDAVAQQSTFQQQIVDNQEKLLANQEKLFGMMTPDGCLKVKIEQR